MLGRGGYARVLAFHGPLPVLDRRARGTFRRAAVQQRRRQQDDRSRSAVGRGPQVHFDAVAGGEPADHEEAEPVAVEEVEGLGLFDAAVGVAQGIRAHAESPVLDLYGVAVAHWFTGDPHARVGRRELGRVLHDLGEQVREVGDGRADDGRLGELTYLHACVVLDLGDGRADDVGQRDRHAPGPAGCRSGEDDQALGVPSHTGGEVVEAEQVAQFVRVLGAAFHAVEEVELTVHQDLAAAGEVHEDPGDAAGEFGAFDGGPQSGAVHCAQGLDDLADLVLRGRTGWGFRLDVDLLPARSLRIASGSL